MKITRMMGLNVAILNDKLRPSVESAPTPCGWGAPLFYIQTRFISLTTHCTACHPPAMRTWCQYCCQRAAPCRRRRLLSPSVHRHHHHIEANWMRIRRREHNLPGLVQFQLVVADIIDSTLFLLLLLLVHRSINLLPLWLAFLFTQRRGWWRWWWSPFARLNYWNTLTARYGEREE